MIYDIIDMKRNFWEGWLLGVVFGSLGTVVLTLISFWYLYG